MKNVAFVDGNGYICDQSRAVNDTLFLAWLLWRKLLRGINITNKNIGVRIMKKKLLTLSLACLPFVAANADTYPYLSFETQDGTTRSVSVESLAITFSDGKLLASNGTDSYEISVASLSRMYFSTDNLTGISTVKSGETSGNMEVYSLSGVRIGTFASAEALRSGVSAGVYIVKSNGKTLKVTVR